MPPKNKSRKTPSKRRPSVSRSRKPSSKKSSKSKKGPNRGTLSKFGYTAKLSKAQKQKAICAASKAWGKQTVLKKLQLVSNLNVNRNPALSRTFSRDRALVKNCK